MRKLQNQLVNVFLVVWLLLSAAGTATAAPLLSSDDVIWKSGPNQYFRYASLDDSDFGQNDHPVTLDPKRIALAIQALKFRSDDFFASEDDLKPVFSVQQSQRLGQELARGLKNAKPEQDILFVLQKSVSKLIFLEDKAYVAGRAFYKEGQLNIIVGAYDVFTNDAYEQLYDSSGQLSPYTLNHGRRSESSAKLASNLVNMDGVQNKVIDNNVRQDWFVIDVDKAVAALERQRNQAERGSDGEVSRQMRLEAARMQKEQRELKLEMARMRKEMREGNGGGSQTVEERLSALEKLYNQELISKEEYETKRQEILGDI